MGYECRWLLLSIRTDSDRNNPSIGLFVYTPMDPIPIPLFHMHCARHCGHLRRNHLGIDPLRQLQRAPGGGRKTLSSLSLTAEVSIRPYRSALFNWFICTSFFTSVDVDEKLLSSVEEIDSSRSLTTILEVSCVFVVETA